MINAFVHANWSQWLCNRLFADVMQSVFEQSTTEKSFLRLSPKGRKVWRILQIGDCSVILRDFAVQLVLRRSRGNWWSHLMKKWKRKKSRETQEREERAVRIFSRSRLLLKCLLWHGWQRNARCIVARLHRHVDYAKLKKAAIMMRP